MATITKYLGLIKKWPRAILNYYVSESGGKRTIYVKRAAFTGAGFVLLSALLAAWIAPSGDHTYYNETSEPQTKLARNDMLSKLDPGQMAGLFNNGEKQKEADDRHESEQRRKRITIKYGAPQIIGVASNDSRAIKIGSKLLGFLLTAIDTREPSLVRVRIPNGGESNDVEIEKNSVLYGSYSYSGQGDKVTLNFTQVISPDGETQKLSAQALDPENYTAGIKGEEFSGAGLKVAAGLGLTMFAGMADVLTEKESLGYSQNAVQDKPTMKNALLQGASHAAQDQAGRTSSEINSTKDYVVVPEGKEMIIQLTQDFKDERRKK
jgi:hypothetical protein